jgi:hypothetical protein
MQLVALSLKMHELALTLAAIQEASIRGDRVVEIEPRRVTRFTAAKNENRKWTGNSQFCELNA